MSHRCWAEIDLGALRANADACRAAAPAGCGLLAIVKAGAYGHGMHLVAPALADRARGFGVANLVEARELAALPGCGTRRIVLLSPVLPDERVAAVAGSFEVCLSTPDEVEAYAAAGAEAGTPAKVHAVADTGMGRMGAVAHDFPALIHRIRERASAGGPIRLVGVATHFPAADEDAAYTRGQIDDFRALLASLALPAGVDVHLANSAGVIGFAGQLDFATLARPGLALYGVSPLPAFQAALVPVLTWKTRLALVRELPVGATISYGRTHTLDRPTRVATLAAGYADGYPRHLSGRGAAVLVDGRRCPVLGRVTMDQIVVDVTDLPRPPRPGDEAVLLGRQGDAEISAHELAEKAGTIPWEILTGIGPRVVRVAR